MANQREDSRANWKSNSTVEDINSGSLQRIADSVELMVRPYLGLLGEVEIYKRRSEELKSDNARMSRRIAALQGVITKLKKKSNPL